MNTTHDLLHSPLPRVDHCPHCMASHDATDPCRCFLCECMLDVEVIVIVLFEKARVAACARCAGSLEKELPAEVH